MTKINEQNDCYNEATTGDVNFDIFAVKVARVSYVCQCSTYSKFEVYKALQCRVYQQTDGQTDGRAALNAVSGNTAYQLITRSSSHTSAVDIGDGTKLTT